MAEAVAIQKKVKTFVSTKAYLLDEAVNTFLENENYAFIDSITPFMSSSTAGYPAPNKRLEPVIYVGCQITYSVMLEEPSENQLVMDILKEV